MSPKLDMRGDPLHVLSSSSGLSLDFLQDPPTWSNMTHGLKHFEASQFGYEM